MPKAKVSVRTWEKKDISAVIDCYKAAYPEFSTLWRADSRLYEMELEAFPQGQLLAEVDGQVVGYATSLIVQLDEVTHRYTYREITGADTFNTHDPAGDTLYGADIAVHPDYRGKGIAGKLYKARKAIVRRYNLRRMLAYGRIPGYQQYAGRMTAEEYVEAVKRGEMKDPALSAHLKAGYQVKGLLLGFVPDMKSMDHSTLLEWENPEFDNNRRRIAAAPLKGATRKVRIGTAQWMMRRIKTWDEFKNTVEFFVDTAEAYHCHFLVLPEMFTSQLFCTMKTDLTFEQVVSELADMTPQYEELFKDYSISRQLYIIAGTHPVRREGRIYNVSHMFTPSGHVYTQDKLHITPNEREDWGTSPGEKVKIFDTAFGRIAIQVCYDIEFPELSRLLGLAGVEVVFVPFCTDDRKAYNRVRYTAQARAVENHFYVVLSGTVGNLPTITNYLLNYGQSCVLTPSDMGFPPDAIAAEADPNTETMVVAELDLSSLALLRDMGSVRPYYDRRPDLYRLELKEEFQLVVVE